MAVLAVISAITMKKLWFTWFKLPEVADRLKLASFAAEIGVLSEPASLPQQVDVEL
jgi:hypothetical protein